MASDCGLSELGKWQAIALRERLIRTREIGANGLFSSTLPRSRQTAEIIAPALGLEVKSVSDLCEWENGSEALGAEMFNARFQQLPLEQRREHRFHPTSETLNEFKSRVEAKLSEVVSEFAEQTAILVVHGGVIEVAFWYFLGGVSRLYEAGYPAAGHTSITGWSRKTGGSEWVLEYSNDTHHLLGGA